MNWKQSLESHSSAGSEGEPILTESGILLNRHANELLQLVALTERETAELREVIVGRLDIASVVIAATRVAASFGRVPDAKSRGLIESSGV